MSENKIKFGLSNVYLAFLKDDTGQGTPEWEKPIHIPGAVNVSLNAEGSESPFRADNMDYHNYFADNGYKGSVETALFPDAILAEIFGWTIDENGGVLEITNGIQKKFALLGQIEGDVSGRRFVYYYCSGSKPAANASTTPSGAITPATDTMNLTVTPLLLPDERKVTKYSLTRTDTNKAIYDAFFESVYVPGVSVPAEA